MRLFFILGSEQPKIIDYIIFHCYQLISKLDSPSHHIRVIVCADYIINSNQLSYHLLQMFLDINLTQAGDNGSYISLTLLFLIFYAIISAFLQHKHLPIHRSAVAIIIGIGVGFLLFIYSDQTYQLLVQINDTIVFSILLPPMLFAQGYTFKKNTFVKNLKNISLYGILGTFLFFVAITLLTIAANQMNLVRDTKDITNIKTLSIWQILLLSACFCSIDTVASEETVSEAKFPKLYSIIVGQDILKDTITIVLFRSILRLEQVQTPSKFIFYWYTSFQIILNFILIIVGSVAVGFVAGCLISFMFRKFRFLGHDEGITQTCSLFLIGFLIYILSEMITMSGVISILAFGMTLNHYNIYNLSEEGRSNSKSTFLVVSIISEGLVFLIMGMMVWQVSWSKETTSPQISHSWIFTIVVFFILMFGRAINVILVGWIAGLLNSKFRLRLQQTKILFISGLVKGATPFALFTSVSIGGKSYGKNEGLVLKSTVIIITIFTSVFLNSIIPKLYRKSLKKMQKQGIEDAKENYKQIAKLCQQGAIKAKVMQNIKKLDMIDQKIMKPLLIYNYQGRKQQILMNKIKDKERKLLDAIDEAEAQNPLDRSMISEQNEQISTRLTT